MLLDLAVDFRIHGRTAEQHNKIYQHFTGRKTAHNSDHSPDSQSCFKIHHCRKKDQKRHCKQNCRDQKFSFFLCCNVTEFTLFGMFPGIFFAHVILLYSICFFSYEYYGLFFSQIFLQDFLWMLPAGFLFCCC